MSIRLHKRKFNVLNLPKKIKSCFSDLNVNLGKKIIKNEINEIMKSTKSFDEINNNLKGNFFHIKKKNDKFQKEINRYKKFSDLKKHFSKGQIISNFKKDYQDLILIYKIKGYNIPDLTTGRHNLFKQNPLCTKKDLNFIYRNQTYFNGNISNNDDKCVIYLKKLRKDIYEKMETNKKKKKLKESGIMINDSKLLDLYLGNDNEKKGKSMNHNLSLETTLYDKKKELEIEDLENYNKTVLDLIKNETSYSTQRSSIKRQSFINSKLHTYIGLFKSPLNRRNSTIFPRKSLKFSSVVPNLNINLKDSCNSLKLIDSPINLNSIKNDNSLNYTIQNKNINDLNNEKLTYKSFEDLKLSKLSKLFKTAMSSPNIRNDKSYINDLEKYFVNYTGIKKEQIENMRNGICENKDIMKFTNSLQRKINTELVDKYKSTYIREKKYEHIKDKLKMMNYLDKEICKLDRYYIKGLNGYPKERVIENN